MIPHNNRDVLVRFDKLWMTGWYSAAGWFVYRTPDHDNTPVTPEVDPDEWIELPKAAAPAAEPDRVTALAQEYAELRRLIASDLDAMLQRLIEVERRVSSDDPLLGVFGGEPIPVYTLIGKLHQRGEILSAHLDRLSEAHDETLKQALARLDALEARTPSPAVPEAEPSVAEMNATIESWWEGTEARYRWLDRPNGWILADPATRFSATGPETGDDATRAAYRKLREAGHV